MTPDTEIPISYYTAAARACQGIGASTEALEAGVLAEMADLLAVIIANAKMIPDPAMAGQTDIYAVPLDDIEDARTILAKLGAKEGT